MADQTLAELFVEIKASNAKLLTALKGAEAKSSSSTKKMQGFFDSLNFKQLIAGAFGFYAVKRAITNLVGTTAQFERAMAGFNTIANLTAKELKAISIEAQNAAGAVGVSPGGFAAAMYQAVSAGVAVNKSIEVTTAAAQLAKAGFTSTTQAVDLLTTTMNAYGSKVESVIQASDILLETQNLGKTTIDEMAGSMGRLIPVAAQLGVDFDVLAAAVATMTAQGVNTFETVTALRSLLVALSSPSEEQQKAWESLELQWSESAIKGDGLVTILTQLAKATGGSIEKLTGLGINQRALIAALSLGGEAADVFAKNIDTIGKSVGRTRKSLKTMEDTLYEQSKILSASFDNLKISWGGFLASAEHGIGVLPTLSTIFNTLAKDTQNMSYNFEIGALKFKKFQTILKLGSHGYGFKRVAAEIKKLDEIINRLDTERALASVNFSNVGGGKGRKRPSILDEGKAEFDALAAAEKRRAKEQEDNAKNAKANKKRIEYLRDERLEMDALGKKEQERSEWQKKYTVERQQAETNLQDRIATLNAEAITDARERAIALEQIRYDQQMRELESIVENQQAIELASTEHAQRLVAINRTADQRKLESVQNFAIKYANILADIIVQSKFSFNSISKAFGAMLASMAAQFAAQAAILSFAGLIPGAGLSVAGAGGFSGILKNVLGFGKAGGGGVSAGRAYRVNDANRPEMFIPSTPGIIAPDMGNGIMKALNRLSAGGNVDRSSTSINFNGSGSDFMDMSRVQIAQTIKEMWRSGELSYMTS